MKVFYGVVVAALAVGACSAGQPDVTSQQQVGENFWTVGVSRKVKASEFEMIAQAICGEARKCMVGIWVGEAPIELPFTENQIMSQKFAYTRNQDTGFLVKTWDCQAYSRYAPDACLPHTK